MKTRGIFLFSIFYFLFSFTSASAAVDLLLDATSPSVNLNDTFIVTFRMNTGGECVNAISSQIKFDPSLLKMVDFSTGESLLSLWTEPPTVDKKNGIISFSGGMPGGYCGRVVGDPGQTNIVGKAVFTAAENIATSTFPVQTQIEIANSEVLLNDGLGTPAEVVPHMLDLSIGNKGGAPKNEWLSEVRADNIAPELFTIELFRDPNIGGGKYFISWATTDKQSGIDHYEVLETNPWKFGFFQSNDMKTYWTVAQSPYFLKDQNLRSKIMVKAIDKMGNERIVEYNPNTSFISIISAVDYAWIEITAVLALSAFLFSAWYMRRKRNII
jgi:hypothetical protein